MGSRRVKRGQAKLRHKKQFDDVMKSVVVPSAKYEQQQKEARAKAMKVLKRVQLQRIIQQQVFG